MPEILIGIAIDVVVRRQDSFLAGAGIEDPAWQLSLLGVLTLAVWVFESVFEYLYMILWRNLAQDLQHAMRLDAYEHLQRLNLAFFEDRSAGNLTTVLNDDVNQLERFLDGGANNLIHVGTTLILVGGVFLVISPLIALVAFTPTPVIVLGAFYFQRRAQPLYAEVRERVGRMGARLAANISGIMTIKSFATEAFEAERVREDSNAYVEANRRAIAISSAFIPIIRMAILAGFVATFLLGGWLVLNGTLNVGAYGVLVFLTQRLLWPLTGLAETVDLFERAMASSRRILDLIESPARLPEHPDARAPGPVAGAIEFVDVSFAYRPDRPVLRSLNLSVGVGQTVAIVGPTGSGKSTIIKLLLRFYLPTAAAFCSTASRSTSLGFAICAVASASSVRMFSCFRVRFATTSLTARRPRPTRRFWKPPGRPRRSSSSRHCRTASTRWSARRASGFPAVSGSACPSPGRC